jgi:uncharacterized protein YcbK (DUF882 family)
MGNLTPNHGRTRPIESLTSFRASADNCPSIVNHPVVNLMRRRHFVSALAAGVPLLALSRRLFAQPASARALSFTHTHTGERLSVEYFSGGDYLQDALATVNHFLRDFRTNEEHAIAPDLLDLLHGLAGLTQTIRPVQVISGYRSPATNEMLRHRSEGVAAGSLHMKGLAIDIRLGDVPLAILRQAAIAIGGGGVGYYPASDFVHVDTGRVRTW